MIIKWRTAPGSIVIQPVECVEENEGSVRILFDGSDVPVWQYRRGMACDYHDTWDAAHAYLVERAEKEVADLHQKILAAVQQRNAVVAMPKPEDAP